MVLAVMIYGFSLWPLLLAYLAGSIIDRLLAKRRMRDLENLLFLTLGKLAREDGRVSREEIDRAELIFLQLGVTGDRRKQAIDHFRRGASGECNFRDEIARFANGPASIMQKSSFIELLVIFSIEEKDGYAQLNPHYRELLAEIVGIMGIDLASFDRLVEVLVAQANFFNEQQAEYSAGSAQPGSRASRRTSLEMAYQALDASESDSDDEIKKKYRRLLSKYHPDKIIGRGIGKEAVKLGKEKTQQITRAYDRIKLARGMK